VSTEKLGVLGKIVDLFSVFKETVVRERAGAGEKVYRANSPP
jgi:hypothetical protein